jgi:hypothetical protein
MILKQLSRIAVGLVLVAATAAAQHDLTTTAQVKLKKRPTSKAHVISLLAAGTNLETLSASVKHGYIWVTDGIDSGWVFKRYTKKASTSIAHTISPSSPSIQPATSTSLAGCPIEGRGKTGNIPSSSDIASNRMKRHLLQLGTATTLTFADFVELQKDVEQIFGIDSHNQTLTLEDSDRKKLHSLAVSNGTVSEGDLVQIVGFVVPPDPHPNTGETVNCYEKGAVNNDFHITLAGETTANSGFDGVVVEMIPQERPPEWSIANLSGVESQKRPVLVIGQLFYDMKHKVNDDPKHKKQGQPVRASLFEIHPISAFLVCRTTTTCRANSAGDWTPLGSH